ncbi:MAG: hypothetical protein EOP34_10115, partial [Rickettsiales bacterium]
DINQSAPLNKVKWIIRYIKYKEDIFMNKSIGWISSNNTNSEVLLKFDSKEDAIRYANKNNLFYKIID